MADFKISAALEESLAANSRLIEMLQAAGKQAKLVKILEDANAEIQSNMNTLEQAKKDKSKTVGFLDVPRELRDEIYRLLLVRGKIFPHPRPHQDFRYLDYNTYETPEWQLLAVNKQVRAEAAEILLSENQVIFPGNTVSTPEDLDFDIGGSSIDLNSLFCRYLKSISVSFDCRNLNDSQSQILVTSRSDAPWDSHEYSARDTLDDHHAFLCHQRGSKYAQDEYWSVVRSLYNYESLKELQIDLSYCYCPLTCCKLDEVVGEAIGTHYCGEFARIPDLEIIGTKTMNDRKCFADKMIWCQGLDWWIHSKDLPRIRFRKFPALADDADQRQHLYMTDSETDLVDQDFDMSPILQEKLKYNRDEKEFWWAQSEGWSPSD